MCSSDLLRRTELAPHYQCVLTREGPLDHLTVRVETRPGLPPDHADAQRAAAQLQHDVKVFVGTSIQIELLPEGGVERSMGKAKRVVDLRPR